MFALLVWILNPEKKSMPALMLAAGLALQSVPAVAMPHPIEMSERGLASMAFPMVRATSDVDDINDDYRAYLNFVLAIGQDVNPAAAKQIESRFERLLKADPNLAARFLKGLRFEIVQKLELTGLSPRNITSDNPTMRRWVGKYIGAWLREVDEAQFRAYAAAIVKR